MYYPQQCRNYAAFPFLGLQAAGFSDIQDSDKDFSHLHAVATEIMSYKLRQFLI